MAQIIQVEIEYNEELPIERRYMASINDENYKMLVSADSIANCFKELSTSIYVSDEYKKQKNYINEINFKQKLEKELIPSIIEMIEKEKKHLHWLKSKDQSNKTVYMFTLKSISFLKHLEDRLSEYISFTKESQITDGKGKLV